MPQKVILDVDTGGDDAVAMLLAGHHKSLDLVAVTVVHGNGSLSTTLDNTLRLLEAGKLADIPVYCGCERPLVCEPIEAHPIQSATLPLPESTISASETHAVEFLIDHFHSDEGPETIYCPLGPQTNLALALRLDPSLAQRIPKIITMAGATSEGNTTPSAEFNILADPESAHIVFNSGIPITMVGLEVTSQALLTLQDAQQIQNAGTPWARIAGEIIHNEVNWFIENLGLDGGQIFDACAVASIIDPQILTVKPMHVDIELYGLHTRGRTVADISQRQSGHLNVDVGVDINRDRFIQILLESMN